MLLNDRSRIFDRGLRASDFSAVRQPKSSSREDVRGTFQPARGEKSWDSKSRIDPEVSHFEM